MSIENDLFSIVFAGYVAEVALACISAPLSLLLYGLVALFRVFPWLPEVPTSEPAIAGEYK